MLAAILFPVFSRARASARKAKCLSNLRQLGLAFTMYADDYDDALPRTTYGSAGGMYSNRYGRGDLPFTWYDEVLPYTRNEDIHNCPEQRCLPPGYRLNDRCSGAPVGAVSDPSSKILVVDGSDIAGSFNYTLRDPSLTNISLRHNGGLNCLYLDGHAKWATFDHIQDVPTYWDPYAEP
jgi:prepilin-type processing-associated H-X9-DG protein